MNNFVLSLVLMGCAHTVSSQFLLDQTYSEYDYFEYTPLKHAYDTSILFRVTEKNDDKVLILNFKQDSITYTLFHARNDYGTVRKYYLLKDSIAIDSINARIDVVNKFWNIYEKAVLLLERERDMSQRFIVLNLSTDQIYSSEKIKERVKFFGLYHNKILSGSINDKVFYDDLDSYIDKLTLRSMEDRQVENLVSLQEDSLKAIGVVNLIRIGERLLITTGTSFPDGNRTNIKNTIFGLKDKSSIADTNLLSDFRFYFYDVSGQLAYVVDEYASLILDQEFRVVGEFLKRRTRPESNVLGYNFMNNEVHSINFRSFLDQKDYKRDFEVIIPVKIYLPLERNLYRLFFDKPLEEKDLQYFDLSDLLILKNMIYAKHNYAFDSKYFQAYFNLFAFYGNESARKSRTNDVQGKLTNTDKANLNIIEKALKELESR